MQALAFEMGILPDAFWCLTLREFCNCLEGYRRRDLIDRRKRAWEVAHLIAPWTKHRITPAMLLGEDAPQGPQPQTAEAFRVVLRERLRRAAEASRKQETSRG